MSLSNLFGWNKKAETQPAAACGTACGAGDKPEEKPAACGTSLRHAEQPAGQETSRLQGRRRGKLWRVRQTPYPAGRM